VSGLPELHRVLVEDAIDMVLAIRQDLTLAYANAAVEEILGYDPEEVVGRKITDFIAESEVERALFGLDAWENSGGVPHGTDTYRARAADGSWRWISTGLVGTELDGEPILVAYGRPADHPKALESVLTGLLEGDERSHTFTPLLDVFDWKANGSHIAIAWYEPDGTHRYVTTGLPRALTGAEAVPGGPWDRARRLLEEIHVPADGDLDDGRRALADELDRGPMWIVPVPDESTGVPALITVWGRKGGMPPEIHVYGMELANTHVELILRWWNQVTRLDDAAHTDALTGLPNRRSLFDLLAEDVDGGALLFCDLDRFKPINDELGHAAGDEVLRLVAERLRASVRAGDVVARTGGDEFVVLAHGATDEEAAALSERIAQALEAPFAVAGTQVELDISIGIARADAGLDHEALARADRAMMADKARHRRRHPTARRA
jgi:diguanylate cyclase (GGDEF)-like protein/PAS domain S-box-containing protein